MIQKTILLVLLLSLSGGTSSQQERGFEMPDLQNRWMRLVTTIATEVSAHKAYQQITAHHTEPHRAYHNLDHVAHMLAEFDSARSVAQDQVALELAIWFHDVIYDTHTKDNEEQSALYAQEALEQLGFSRDIQNTVATLILATKHDSVPTDTDAQLLVDIDLSILGQPRERFKIYDEQIRQEYAWVPDDQFAAGRSSILQGFLDRESIYTTDLFRRRYEDTARNNLRWSLNLLK